MRTGLITFILFTAGALSAAAQAPLPNPQVPPVYGAQASVPEPSAQPSYPPMELDRITSPVALYPDPLLAQLLTAATFASDIPDAANWANQHHYLMPDAIAQAAARDQVPWDPSVQALLPFPSVLDMMASDMPWTEELGDAFLAQPQDVMDAVQRDRQMAVNYGYLRSNAQVRVVTGPYIEIQPVDPAFVVVPYYNPAVVFVRPRPGFRVAAAINFGFGVRIGVAWAPWGWGSSRFIWNTHTVIINSAPWRRTWGNRATYTHPYAVRRYPTRAPEAHRLEGRTPRERQDERSGRRHKEDHH